MEQLTGKFFKALFEKNALQRRIARALFGPLQVVGIHITGDHFYDIVPNTKLIEKTYSKHARKCVGIDFQFAESEIRFVEQLAKYMEEILDGEIFSCGFDNNNSYFFDVDAIALYICIREMRPATIVEIGQGVSTKVMAAACRRNWNDADHITRLITIDPYARLTASDLLVEGVDVEIIRREVQLADPSVFKSLEPNDLLFVDSSHVFKFGSDVEYEFESIYPQMCKDVLIHIHDIFSPYEYPKPFLVERKQFWNEQYHLEQFLRFNANFEVVLPVHFLMRSSSAVRSLIGETLSEIGISTRGQSFYMKRTR